MSIESRIPQEDLNIKDLSFEKTDLNSDLVFDPERDIEQTKKEEIVTTMQDMRRRLSPFSDVGFADVAADVKILFPKEYEKAKVGEKEFEMLHKIYLSAKNRAETEFPRHDFSNWSGFAHKGRGLKLLFPERRSALGLDQNIFEELRTVMNKRMDDRPNDIYNADFALDIVTLYPKGREDLQLPAHLWNRLSETIEWQRNSTPIDDHYARTLFWAKFLFPKEASQIVLEDNDWQLMNDGLKEISEDPGRIKNFATAASKMKFLAMDNLKITDKGYSFSMPKNKLKSPPTSMPEERKF